MVDQKMLRERYEYLAGKLINRKTGKMVTGSENSNGYLVLGVANRTMKYHRAVWLWHHGSLPQMLDHINRDKKDNRIENLRPCTRSQNFANMQAHKYKNKALPKGVHRNGYGFCARITHNRKNHYLGQFRTPEEAAGAYDKKAKELFGDFASRNS